MECLSILLNLLLGLHAFELVVLTIGSYNLHTHLFEHFP